MIYALYLVIAWLLVAIMVLAKHRAKYKHAFRDVATQLYNVTAERNELSISNAGFQSRLDKWSGSNRDGKPTDFHCPKCKTNLHYSMLEYAATRKVSASKQDRKPEHLE